MNGLHNVVIHIPNAHEGATREQGDNTDHSNNDENSCQSLGFQGLKYLINLHYCNDHCAQSDQLVNIEKNTVVGSPDFAQPKTEEQCQ